MNKNVLDTLFDFVNGNLPDVAIGSGIKMDARALRSIGMLPDCLRPLTFVHKQTVSEEDKIARNILDSLFETMRTETVPDNLGEEMEKAGKLAVTDEALKKIFWEGVSMEIPNLFDYESSLIVTDDWQIAVARMTPEPRFQSFDNGSLPASFFKILSKVLKGGIHWDGMPQLEKINHKMRIVGNLEKTFARQFFIFRRALTEVEEKLKIQFRKGRGMDEFREQVTLAEAERFSKKIRRLELQQKILTLLLSEYISDFCSEQSGVLVCEGWYLAVPQ